MGEYYALTQYCSQLICMNSLMSIQQQLCEVGMVTKLLQGYSGIQTTGTLTCQPGLSASVLYYPLSQVLPSPNGKNATWTACSAFNSSTLVMRNLEAAVMAQVLGRPTLSFRLLALAWSTASYCSH